MKIVCCRQTFTEQTDERTEICIYWAPVGAKNGWVVCISFNPFTFRDFMMGGLTDTDDIRMTNLDSQEHFIKQVDEENDPVEDPTITEDGDTTDDHAKVVGEDVEVENPTPEISDIIPEIQIITAVDNESLNSENVVEVNVNEETQISADTIDVDQSIISQEEESTTAFGQNTQEVEDVVSVSSEIVTNIEAGILWDTETDRKNKFTFS